MIKVRIKKVPKARTGYQVQGALVNDVPAMGGMDYNAYIGAPKLKESKYITAVPRDEANLEAEGGETVYGDINGDGMPEHKIIKGPRHAQGGVPLSLPEDTFIFSDTRAMKIKDPELLAMFGKGGSNQSFTPAELAKQYDVQKYRKILEDPDTDAIERKTAELMIKKFVVKLGCLALAQESMKGFPQGIPAVAKPCMEARGLSEQDILPNKEITVLNDQLKKQMEQQQGGDENMVQDAMAMNQGNPVAESQEMGMEEQPMMEPSPEAMMMYGGHRRLRRAQQGMEQMQPQQGGQDQMMQIIQEVQAALQRGAEPAEVVMSLLQNGLPPEGIVQIFAQLGASTEEAAGLVQQVMQQAQGGGQEQMMAQQPMEGQPMPQEAMMQQPGMMSYGGVGKRTLKRAAYGLSKDPCPDGSYWDDYRKECVPYAQGVPSREQLFNDPMMMDYLNKLNRKRNVQDYKDYRINKLSEYRQQNYKGPMIQDEDGSSYPDRTSPEWNQYINSEEFKKLRDSLPDPEQLEEQFEFPQEYQQKDYYPKEGEWDERSKEQYNDFFNPEDEYYEQQKVMEQYLQQNPEIQYELEDLRKQRKWNEKDRREQEIYESIPEYERQYKFKPGELQKERYDDWCPCYKTEDIIVQGRPTQRKICVPCEQMSMAAYGMSMGGYDMPFFDIPQAEYGMTMGSGMSQNYQGRPKRIPGSRPMFPIAKAQDGIEVQYDPKWENDPALKDRALRLAYAQARKKGANTNIYVVKDGKRIQQKVSATGHDTYSGADLNKWNGNVVAAATYEAMKQTFNDPKAKAAFAKQVRASLSDKEAYKGKTGVYSKMYKDRFGKDPNTLTDDEIVEKYLRMQERNLKTTTYGDRLGVKGFGSWMYKDATGDLRPMDDLGDRNGNGKIDGDELGFKSVVKSAFPNITDAEITEMRNKIVNSGFTSLDKLSKDMGLPMERVGVTGRAASPYDEEAYIQQAGFIAADRLMKDLDANPGNYDDETAASLLGITSFAGFSPYGKQVGYSDETGMGVINISPIDAYYTNTTQGQIQAHHGLKFEDVLEGVDPNCQCDDPNAPNYSKYKDAQGNCTCTPPDMKKCPCQKSDGTVIEMAPDASGQCPPCVEDQDIEVPGPPAAWWLQDTIKTTGAFGDLMGIKKYMPWAPGVDLETPRPTFLDPTRELAANAEQANIQTQGMAQFAGPQALSARSAGIQGQAAKNAADVLSKYNNANVNIANQFEMKATDVRNQESMLKQATAQRLYDQNTVANQQFDNAKLAMRNNLRNYYTNAITNRWKTDALNQMYPNYAVDPSVGGRMDFIPTNRTPNPQSTGGMTMQEAMDWCKKNNPNATDHSACMQRVMTTQSKTGNTSVADSGMLNTMYPSQMGGPVYEDGGYVHINSWLPFIM